MDLTADTDLNAFHRDLGATAGVVGGMILHGSVTTCGNIQALEDGLDLSLQGEEVRTLAVGTQNQTLGLCGKHLTLYGEVDLCQLIELDIIVMVVIVSAENGEHGGQGYGTHDGGVLTQRVLNDQSVPQGRILGQTDHVKDVGRDEGIAEDLAVAKTAAQRACQILLHHSSGVATLCGFGTEGGGGDHIIAIESAYLLCNICHDLQIGTEGGNVDGSALYGDLQTAEIFYHVGLGNVGAEEGIDPLNLQLHSTGLGDIVEDIDHAIHDFSGAQKLYQLTGTVDGRDGKHGINVLLKLAGGFGTHAQREGSLTDGGAVKVGRLKDHIHGVVYDLGVLATHDTGKTDGLLSIGNDQHAGSQLSTVAIQSDQSFTLHSFTDDDLLGGNIAIVKGMHGLTVFQHDIVGDIDDVVNGADTVGTESLAEPLGGGGDLHIANHTGGVAVAESICGNLYIDHVRKLTLCAATDDRLVVLHRQVEGGGRLTGKANERIAVGTVVGDFEFYHRVIIADDGVDVITGLAILFQNPDAVLDGIGNVVEGQVQLLNGAEHAIGDLTPELALGNLDTAGETGIVKSGGNQVTLLHVLCAGDDLYRLFLAHIYLTDPHVVGVGVALNGQDLAYDNIADLSIQPFIGLDLLTGYGESFYIFFIGNVGQIHEFLMEPFSV